MSRLAGTAVFTLVLLHLVVAAPLAVEAASTGARLRNVDSAAGFAQGVTLERRATASSTSSGSTQQSAQDLLSMVVAAIGRLTGTTTNKAAGLSTKQRVSYSTLVAFGASYTGAQNLPPFFLRTFPNAGPAAMGKSPANRVRGRSLQITRIGARTPIAGLSGITRRGQRGAGGTRTARSRSNTWSTRLSARRCRRVRAESSCSTVCRDSPSWLCRKPRLTRDFSTDAYGGSVIQNGLDGTGASWPCSKDQVRAWVALVRSVRQPLTCLNMQVATYLADVSSGAVAATSGRTLLYFNTGAFAGPARRCRG